MKWYSFNEINTSKYVSEQEFKENHVDILEDNDYNAYRTLYELQFNNGLEFSSNFFQSLHHFDKPHGVDKVIILNDGKEMKIFNITDNLSSHITEDDVLSSDWRGWTFEDVDKQILHSTDKTDIRDRLVRAIKSEITFMHSNFVLSDFTSEYVYKTYEEQYLNDILANEPKDSEKWLSRCFISYNRSFLILIYLQENVYLSEMYGYIPELNETALKAFSQLKEVDHIGNDYIKLITDVKGSLRLHSSLQNAIDRINELVNDLGLTKEIFE